MSRQRIRAGVTLATFMAGTAIAAILVGMAAVSMSDQQPSDGGPSPAAGNASAPLAPILDGPMTTTTEPPPPIPPVRSTFGKTVSALQINIGDCVELGHTGDRTTIGKAECGSTHANYKIIEKAPADTPCPSDADRVYNDTLRGAVRAALCLDIDWVIGGCMELGDTPKRIDCTTRGTPTGVKVVEIKPNITDVNTCSTGDRGIVYQQRRFVICVARP